MTAYTTIANSDIEPEAPVTSELMTAFRDNLVSVAEGDDTNVSTPRITSPALDLSHKTGSVTLTTSTDSNIVVLDTTDLSNLEDMTLALVTGTVECSTSDTLTTRITCNRVTPSYLLDTTQTGSFSFSHLAVLSSAANINLRLDITGSGTFSATAYGQILILGR